MAKTILVPQMSDSFNLEEILQDYIDNKDKLKTDLFSYIFDRGYYEGRGDGYHEGQTDL